MIRMVRLWHPLLLQYCQLPGLSLNIIEIKMIPRTIKCQACVPIWSPSNISLSLLGGFCVVESGGENTLVNHLSLIRFAVTFHIIHIECLFGLKTRDGKCEGCTLGFPPNLSVPSQGLAYSLFKRMIALLLARQGRRGSLVGSSLS